MSNTVSWVEPKVAHYEFSIEIGGSAQRAWKALTDQLGAAVQHFDTRLGTIQCRK